MSSSTLRRFPVMRQSDPADVQGLDASHAAVTEMRTLFPSTVVSTSDNNALLVSGHNNRKIGKTVTKGAWKGMPIYTLTLEERATCPSDCYMLKECYGNAMHMARRNSHGGDFEDALTGEVLELAEQHPAGFVVRLHVLGDFYSVDYVETWDWLLDSIKELHVYGYTMRTGDIGRAVAGLNEKFPERCFIRQSCPPDVAPIAMGATVIDTIPATNKVPQGFVCPAETSKTDCCATCGLCWSPAHRDETVVFIKHGKGASENKAIATQVNIKSVGSLRAVAPITLAGPAKPAPLEGEIVCFREVAPESLLVDETYQRRMSAKGARLVRTIAMTWSWRKFNPPTVVEVEQGRYHVIDGQHTAIAAASRGDIKTIWVKVVDASTIAEQAATFVGINRDRIAVSNNDVFYAEIAAGDETARAVKAMCDKAGLVVLRQPPSGNRFGVGETMAIMTLRRLYRRYGATRGERALRTCVEAGMAPVKDWGIEAVSFLMFASKAAPNLSSSQIVTAIRAAGPQLSSLAHGHQATTGVRMPEAYAHIIRRFSK